MLCNLMKNLCCCLFEFSQSTEDTDNCKGLTDVDIIGCVMEGDRVVVWCGFHLLLDFPVACP